MRHGLMLLMWLLFSSFAAAQSLEGTYTLEQNGGRLTLQLREAGGQLSGTLIGDGGTYQLRGRVRGFEAEGTLSDGSDTYYFYLKLQGGQLTLVVSELDDNNQPDQSTAQQYVFARQGGSSPPPAATASPAPATVDGLVGKFSGSGVTLELKGGGGTYTGSIVWGGKTYPVKAQGSGTRAIGQFTVGKETLIFDARLNGNTLTLAVAGKQYALARVVTASKPNPPAAPVKPAPPPPPTSAPAPAVSGNAELRDGATYKAGTRVTAKLHGVSFVVPQGFNAQSKDGVALLTNGQGIGALVLPFFGATGADVIALMSRDVEVSASLSFKATGAAQARGNQLLLRYTANTNAGQLVATGIAVLGKGNGVSYWVFSDAAQAGAVDRLAASLAAGTAFGPSSLGPTLEAVRRGLGGKYLNFFSYTSLPGGTYTGPSDRSSQSTWNLCSDGSYRYEGSSENRYTLLSPPAVDGSSFGVSPDRVGVAGGSGDANAGRWRAIIVGNSVALVLYAGDGSMDFHLLSNLERANGKLPFMDGRELSSFGASNLCR